MRFGVRIGLLGIVLVAVGAMLAGCGGGASGSTTEDRREAERPLPPEPPPIVAHRVGPARVEPGEPAEVLSASPCPNNGVNGTTTIPVASDIGHCAQVAPDGRLAVENFTGFDGREGVTVRVRIGEYAMRLRPRQTGTIPAPARAYLGRGGHPVRVHGGLGSTVWVLPPGCVLRPPAKAGERLCFPKYAARLKGG